jgi:hypothetical protein
MTENQQEKINPVLNRMLHYLEIKGIALTKADKMMSSGNGRLGKMSKSNTIPKEPFIEKFLSTFKEVNENWLMRDEGEMINKITTNQLKDIPRKITSNAKFIGAYDESEFEEGSRFRRVGPDRWAMKVELITEKAKAGWLRGFADQEYQETLPETEVIVDFVVKGRYFAFEADGDSMYDGSINSIPDKSLVVVRELPQHQWLPRLYNHEYPNWVFVHKTDGILVKQIADQNLEEGWLIHKSLNPNKELYPDEKILIKDIQKIFNVVKRILP